MCFLLNSIPIEIRNGKTQYSECKMYVRNYTEVLRLLHSTSEPELAKIENEYEENPHILGNEDYEIVDCTDGWVYDRRMFPNTVVMEVLYTAY